MNRYFGIWLGIALCMSVCVGGQRASADPCGMVPPVYTGGGDPIRRVGPQKTYVFYKNGIESIVLRPGFSGKVEQFGMLIPFPSPPAIRKVADNIFTHVAAAIDPPMVRVYIPRPRLKGLSRDYSYAPRPPSAPAMKRPGIKPAFVRVLRKEAVGMYQVAVLQAGSAKALKRWMDSHGYRYPTGMDKVCEEYVKIGWTFVAVKARVAGKKGVQPQPGMRKARARFPRGGQFRGKVQAMGFRFRTKKLVVPMRLSAFNKGRLRNVVYLLTTGPRQIRHIPRRHVMMQMSGRKLYRNVTKLLPMHVVNGKPSEIQKYQWPGIQQRRNPKPYNGLAKNLFAADLLATRRRKLSLVHEEYKKVLLRIGERLMLRGKVLDRLHREALAEERQETVNKALKTLKGMTMTVVDGDFPRKVIARENLTFPSYQRPQNTNPRRYYSARRLSMAYVPTYGTITYWQGPKWSIPKPPPARPRPKRTKASNPGARSKNPYYRLIAQFADAKAANRAVAAMVKKGKKAIPYLLGEAAEGENLVRRGWSFVALAEIGRRIVDLQLVPIQNDTRQMKLIRTWAVATRIHLARSMKKLQQFSRFRYQLPATRRPLRKKMLAIFRSREKKSLREMLLVQRQLPSLRQQLQSQILAAQPRRLVRVMLRDKDTSVRRLAAGYLGAQVRSKPKAVVKALLKGYRFRPKASKPPWAGGALYVPNIRWQGYEARKLVSSLIAWMLWCDKNGMKKEHRQIHNNLRSLSLARIAGYRSPGWRTTPVERWVRIWGEAVGRQAIRAILKRQNLHNDERFTKALQGLR